MRVIMASKLGCWTLEDVQPQGRHSFLKFSPATLHFSPELKSLQVSGSPGEEHGDQSMDRNPFYEFGDKGWNASLSGGPPLEPYLAYSSQHIVHVDLEKITAS
jgi:hypothetical protein